MKLRRTGKIGVAVVVAALALGGAAAVAGADQQDSTETTDSKQWRDDAQEAFDELLRQQEKAWETESGADFAATFTEDGDVVTFNGDHLSGREGIATGMQFYFDEYIEDSKLLTIDEQVRFVDRKLAVIVRVGCPLHGGATECDEESLSTNTNVMRYDDGEWLQESFQNTRKFGLP